MRKILLLTFIVSTMSFGGDKSAEKMYKANCALCHSSDMMGAPVLNSKIDWENVSKKGLNSVYKNTINGIKTMPARGGSSLSDEEIKKVVDYMMLSGGQKVDRDKANKETKTEKNRIAGTVVTLDGLELGMSKEDVLKLKFPKGNAKLNKLDYIEKIYYRNMGNDLEKNFYIYKAKIADVDAYIWLWFSNKTSELYAMRVEWRDPNPNDVSLYKLHTDVKKILTKKYGESSRGVRKVRDIEIIDKLARVSVDKTFFRNLVTITYIDRKIEKAHKESLTPYVRPSTGL